MYHSLLIHSSADGHLGCFHVLAIINSIETVYCQGWNRSPAQAGCMRQVLRAGALGRPRGMGWGGRRERGSGWGTHVNPWPIHVIVWQKPLQYCNVISLQLIKRKERDMQVKLFDEDCLSKILSYWAFFCRKSRSVNIFAYSCDVIRLRCYV